MCISRLVHISRSLSLSFSPSPSFSLSFSRSLSSSPPPPSPSPSSPSSSRLQGPKDARSHVLVHLSFISRESTLHQFLSVLSHLLLVTLSLSACHLSIFLVSCPLASCVFLLPSPIRCMHSQLNENLPEVMPELSGRHSISLAGISSMSSLQQPACKREWHAHAYVLHMHAPAWRDAHACTRVSGGREY